MALKSILRWFTEAFRERDRIGYGELSDERPSANKQLHAMSCTVVVPILKPRVQPMNDKIRRAYEDQSHGRLDAAEQGFQEILSADPQNALGLRGLGLVRHLQGNSQEALNLLRAAVNAGHGDPLFRSNLAAVLGHLGRHKEAAEELRLALATRPDFAEAWQNLGVALERQGKFEEAVDAHRKAASLTPFDAHAYECLGDALRQLRRWPEAEEAYRAASRLTPNNGTLHHKLGLILQKLKRPREAAAEYEKAIASDPTSVEMRLQLGRLYDANGKYFAAASVLEKAIVLEPRSQDAHWIAAHTHGELGNLDQILTHLRQSVALAPNSPSAHSALLYTLHYDDRSTRATLFDEHLKWGRRHADPFRPLRRPHDNDRSPARRLRIGYVSPDFRDHTVPRFISAAIEHHDHAQFEVLCYSNSRKKDATTAKLQAWDEQWREIADLNDEKAEQLIRDDRIDILIDLRGHAANHRLTLFAHKPAPVQGVMVGYFNTTGVSAIDSRITDERQDPTGKSDPFHVEKLARLPHGAWCYRADDNAPPVEDLSASLNGFITFGCLNKIIKVVPTCAQLWGELLHLVPKSRLLLVAPEADRSGHLKKRLKESGIDSNQLTILDKAPSRLEYLRRFNQIDFCLDPFPFNGITTTCDGLWMGSPTVSLSCDTTISRAGSSILTAAGLGDLVANDPRQFLHIASDLANDEERLQQLRSVNAPAPTAPTNLAGTSATSSSISMSWSASSGRVTAYHIQRLENGQYVEVGQTGPSTFNFTDTGLQSGTSYTYRVWAENGGTPSPYSSSSTLLTAPAAPTNFAAIPQTPTSIGLTWTGSTGASSYTILRKGPNDSGFTPIATNLTGTNYTSSGLTPQSTYSYEVEAVNSGGTSSASSTSATTPAIPSAPTALNYTVNSGPTVTLNWTAPSGTTVTNYHIWRSSDGGNTFQQLSGNVQQTTYPDSTVQPGNTYIYKVTAEWSGSVSPDSTPVTVNIAPVAPSNLAAAMVTSPFSVSLTWTGSAGTTAYHVERSQDNGNTFTEIAANVVTPSYSDTTVLANVTYVYRVRAERNGAFSGYSSNSGAVTPPLIAPSNLVVTGVSITETGSPPPSPNTPPSVPLSWSQSPGATGYHVERSIDGVTFYEITWQGAVQTTTYTDTTALPGFTYTYRVRAEDNGQFSSYSNTTQATLAPPAPTDVIAQYTAGGQVNLTWNNTIGVIGYEVLRALQGVGSFVLVGSSTGLSFTDNSALSGKQYRYEVVGFNNDGTSSPSTAVSPLSASFATATVVGRWIFYNNSVFDGNDPTANSNDDAAIAPDKQALLPGQASTFANFTSYSSGINGIMIDVADLAGTPTASDFNFLVGDTTNLSSWAAAPAPASVLVRPGAGVLGSTRIEITWADGSMRDEWLQVSVAADSNTGLTTPDVFYFGNLTGSANGTLSNGQYIVTSNDSSTARNDPHGFTNPVADWYPTDFNRHGKVDVSDQLIARYTYQATPLPQLQYIVAAPGTPYMVSAGGSPAQVTIGWPAANDPNVTSYTVNRVDGSGNHQQFTNITGTSFTDTSVTVGTSYTYTVIALDAYGDASIPSAPLSVTPSHATIQAIADQTVNEGATLTISTTFTDPVTTNTHTASIVWGDGSTSAATITESNGTGTITASHPYPIGGALSATVTLIDQNGAAAATSFAVNVLPAAPSNLVATAASFSTIDLSWSNNSPSVTDFEIQQYNSSTGSWSLLDEVPGWQTSYVAGGLAASQSYTFQVVADNDAGQSVASNSASATTQALPTPTISSPASASGGDTVTGTTVQLSVDATDSGGGSDLIYTWTTTTLPAGAQAPSFSDNADNSTSSVTATFSTAGSYTFLVTITDGDGGTSTSQVTVNVQQTLTSIGITPPTATLAANQTQQLTATAYDQFGNNMSGQPSFAWSVTDGGGTVGTSGLFTAPSSGTSSTVQATAQGVSAQAEITIGGMYQVTITGSAYEPGYSGSNITDNLAVSQPGWIIASSPEDAVQKAVSGSVVLNTGYLDGHSTLTFPTDLGPEGFAILASDNEQAANHLTWNSSTDQYTGAIGAWDGDPGVPYDWDFYFNLTVKTINLNALTVADATNVGNSASATNPSTQNIYVPEQASGSALANLSAAIAPDSTDAAGDVLWSVNDQTGSVVASGNFANSVSLTITPVNNDYDFVATAGVDANGNGTEWHSLKHRP